MIFKSEYGYSTSISSKNMNGEYDKMYLSVQMPKDTVLENKTNIIITNGFLSFYKTKDGLTKPKIVVMEYELENDESYVREERQAIQNEEFYGEDISDLPF